MALLAFVFVAGCGVVSSRGTDPVLPSTTPDLSGGGVEPPLIQDGGSSQAGCAGQAAGCYTVYAHSDHVLYLVDLMSKSLHKVGPFKAPNVGGSEDVITDLAVSPNDVIYAISASSLYTADAQDGHVTKVGALSACGTMAVALTFTPDGSLYTADFGGAFCKIDLTKTPPMVTQVSTLGTNLAISGDLVAVADGTLYGTAYLLNDGKTDGNNLLIEINPMTGKATRQIGATGFPKLFGVSYALGQVFGFTHDGSGDVVTIDPMTGKGTLFNSFKDPSTGVGIPFAGAGVNAMVPATIN